MTPTTPFKPTPDGWIHIAPQGTFPHPNGTMQVLDPEAFQAMQRTFDEEAKQPNFPGLLVDFDHFSHDPAQASTAAGWIEALQPRDDGLHAKVRWSDLGQQALAGGRYRLASPVWSTRDCDQWTAPVGPDARHTVHLRPRRLDRLALTNDPNLPGLAPLSNRRQAPLADDVAHRPALKLPASAAAIRRTVLDTLRLPATATESEISGALTRQANEVETLRHRCVQLQDAQAEHDLDRFGDVIVNRDVVRAQLVANREGTLALLQALRHPEPPAPLHQPRLHRPHLHLLSPATAEADPGVARRVANRARQLQSQLKIGHHAAFRLAEGEADGPEAA